MEAFINYFFKVSGVLILFYLLYQGLLKKETFFKGNRFFLLGGLVVSFIVPFFYITQYVEASVVPIQKVFPIAMINTASVMDNGINWMQIGFWIYLTGVLVFSARFFIQLASLGKLISRGTTIKLKGFRQVETSREIAPFSFFKYIVYNPDMYTSQELEAIINHEKEHSSQWHSFDVILVHIISIILWINPFIWLYKKAIQQNLEFLADYSATRTLSSTKGYQKTLLKVSGNQYCTLLTNNFYNSLIKKRIVMLNTSKSKNRNLWKYTLMIPLLVGFIFVFNTKVVAQKKDEVHVTSNELHRIKMSIDKHTTEEELKNLKTRVKNELGGSFKYSNVKRNGKGEITAIKIEFNDNNGSQASSSFDNDEGIPTIYFGSSSKGGVFINTNRARYHYSTASSSSGSGGNTFYVRSSKKPHTEGSEYFFSHEDGEHTNIEISEENGKEVIRLNGKIITREELEAFEKKHAAKNRFKVKRLHGKGSSDTYIIRDRDDHSDIEVVDKENNGFFFIDTDGKEPIYYINGKKVTREEVENLKPGNIESMQVWKGDKAIKKYGSKAKDGVVEITTKKDR